MSYLGFIIATILPWALGIACLRAIWPSKQKYSLAMFIGYGYLFGIVTTILFIWLWDAVGLKQHFLLQSMILITVTACLYWLRSKNSWQTTTHHWRNQAVWEKILWLLFFVLLAARLFTILQEILQRPLYPWDAWWHYAPPAKIWRYWQEFTPIVHPDDWLNSSALKTYTLDSWSKPLGIPLINYWTISGISQWNDVLMNLPWFLCVLALGFGMYGQLRLVHVAPLHSIIAVYLLLSMPTLDTHAVLAGYADIWLATCYSFSAMSLMLWLKYRNPSQLTLFIILAAAAPVFKIPGIHWSLTLLPVLILPLISSRHRLYAIIICIAASLAFFLSGGISLNLPYVGKHSLTYHDVWTSVANNLLVYDNWHLYWYLLPAALFIGFKKEFQNILDIAGFVLIFINLLFLYIVFFWTEKYIWALDNTTINRATLHLMPIFFFATIVLMRKNNRLNGNTVNNFNSSRTNTNPA